MEETKKPIYLDYAATTPVDPEVANLMRYYMVEEFGNAGSRTHEYGTRAKQAVQKARQQIATIAACQPDEVIFTSGATESNNLAILGFRKFAKESGRKHIIISNIEHKAVLEPVEHLQKEYGFEVDYASVGRDGIVHVEEVEKLLRPDTLLVSLMHVNNETGIIQPIDGVAELLKRHPAFFHTDASQSFGKLIGPLQNTRIDLVSVSGHKIYGPKGVGALVAKRRNYRKPPLSPLFFGGGQEFGLRPGTHPVFLIAGLGLAAEISLKFHAERSAHMHEVGKKIRGAFPLNNIFEFLENSPRVEGVLNIASSSLDSEFLLLKIKQVVSASNGSACTASSYSESYVVKNIEPDLANKFLRLSWSHHLTIKEGVKIKKLLRGIG